jgi:hypothetical protein
MTMGCTTRARASTASSPETCCRRCRPGVPIEFYITGTDLRGESADAA